MTSAPPRPSTPTRPAAGRASHAHYAGLDGLRALAVASVAIYHVFPGRLRGGFLGVDVFFVISGFLITTLFVAERDRTGDISPTRFWGRRARRLLPALAVVVLACASLALAIGGDVLFGLGRQVLGSATFTSNWLDIGAGQSYFSDSAPELFRNFWSLAVEEQFYLVWPPVLLLLLAVGSARVRMWAVGAAAAASALLMAVDFAPGSDPTRVYFGTDTHAFGLMLGALLALMLHGARARDEAAGAGVPGLVGASPSRRWLQPVGIVALALLIALMFVLSDVSTWTYRGGLLAVAVLTAVVILAAVAPRSRLGGALDVAPLRWVGRRSYGLYLWHWPVYVLITSALPPVTLAGSRSAFPGVMALVIATAAAALSFRYVEEPIRRHGFRASVRFVATSIRGSVRSRHRTLWAGGIAIVAIAATVTALAVEPAHTSAQLAIERGERALAVQQAADAASPDPITSPATVSPSSTPLAPDQTAQPGPNGTPAPITTPAVVPAFDFATMPSGKQIYAIGDSVMLASAPALQQRFPGIAIDAKVSRQMSAAPKIVRELAKKHRLRPVLVLGLGTNGSITPSELDAVRKALGPDRELVLVTTQAPRGWTPEVVATLRAYARAHPGDVILSDWRHAIAHHLDLLASDQIHPGMRGGRIYASTLSTALKTHCAAVRAENG